MGDASTVVADMRCRSRSLPRSTPDLRKIRGGLTGLLVDGSRKYPASRLLDSSAGRGWSTISAELRSHSVGRITSASQQNVEIVIALTGSNDGFVTRIGAGQQQQTRSTSGTIWLVPLGIGEEEIVITAPIQRVLHLYLPARQFSFLADQHNLPQSPLNSIPYIGGLRDELIRQIGLSILGEMTHETATGRMFVETSSLMLAGRLAHNYDDGRIIDSSVEFVHRLDNARLRRVLDYIEQHLEEEITVAGLANLANLSTFHFTRMFAAATGLPPHRYVGQRRLENAMAMLVTGKLPLSQIAFRSCFSSQASFNRAFRRVTGLSPGEYRRLRR